VGTLAQEKNKNILLGAVLSGPATGLIAVMATASSYVEWAAVTAAAAYAVTGAVAAIRFLGKDVIERRRIQIADAIDAALGRKVSRYERCYQEWVLARLRFLDSKGLSLTSSHTPELDAVYVDVQLEFSAPHTIPGGVLGDTLDEPLGHPITTYLNDGDRRVFAVVGGPGSGKTTLLRHLARRSARSKRKQNRRNIPILLILRDIANEINDRPDTPLAKIVREKTPSLRINEPDGWWEQQLHSGNCLILLDGLDEVATADVRRSITSWIEQQITQFPENEFVITSRPHGYRFSSIAQANVLKVLPFTRTQVESFLHGWYRSAERVMTGRNDASVEMHADEQAKELISRLDSAPALHDLTVNPLLLTMIALVHKERKTLPGGRVDLYREICHGLLWVRSESKQIESKITGPNKQRIMSHLAFDMMIRKVRDLSRRDAIECISQPLRRLAADVSPADFLDEVSGNGIVVERERDQIAFAHHTIGEYLAARHIEYNNLESVLVSNVIDPWWRETTVLYSAETNADRIVEACLLAGTVSSLTLAFECVQIQSSISPDLQGKLDQILHESLGHTATVDKRRLITGVIATRHFRETVRSIDGALICRDPVTASLYRLFCMDTYTPMPDDDGAIYFTSDTQLVAGVWREDAQLFVDWVNEMAVFDETFRYRLPSSAEVDQLLANAAPIREILKSRKLAVWTASEANFRNPSVPYSEFGDIYRVDVQAIKDAVVADLSRYPVITQLSLAHARILARCPQADHTHRNELSLGLSRLVVVENSRHTAAFDSLTAVEVNRVLHKIRTQAAERGDLFTLEAFPRVDLAKLLDAARSAAANRYPGPLSAVDRVLASNLYREICVPLGLPIDERMSIGDIGGHHDTDARLMMGEVLAKLFFAIDPVENDQMHARSLTDIASEFTDSLILESGLEAFESLSVKPGELRRLLEKATSVVLDECQDTQSWPYRVARQLLTTAEPLVSRRTRLGGMTAFQIRLPSLLLAAEAQRANLNDAASDLRRLAAGITLMERRLSGAVPRESLILVREEGIGAGHPAALQES
jgi:hypothetical protein